MKFDEPCLGRPHTCPGQRSRSIRCWAGTYR